jgi:hypothetical protein
MTINILIYSNKNDGYVNYSFSKKINYQYKLNKKRNANYNFEKHDNLFLATLHRECEKFATFDHYSDEINQKKYDVLIVINYISKEILSSLKIKNKYLLLCEPKAIMPSIYKREYLNNFDKIFTFNENLVDNKKFIKTRLTLTTSKYFAVLRNKKKNLSCYFVANRPSDKSLFRFRIKLISWFNNNYSDYFHLYGKDWHFLKKDTKNIYVKIILRIINYIINILNITLINKHIIKNVYKGFSRNKIKDGSKYYFQFCIENSREWISQRIFHCFNSGSVPVYFGYKNISKFIPNNCYILIKDQNNFQEVFNKMQKVCANKKIYKKYLDNIKKFIKSEKIKEFFLENDVEIIKKNLLKDYFYKTN